MAEPDKTIRTTDLILKCSVAQIPMSVRLTLKNDKWEELSGCVTINKTLGSILDDLGANFREAVTELNNQKLVVGKVLKNITLERLAVGYNIVQKFAQVVVTMTIGGSSCHFVLLKSTGDGGLIVGLDLQSNMTLKNNLLSGLIGEISIPDLGVYYASKAFKDLKYYPSQAFQDVDLLIPTSQEIKGRNFREGWNVSAEILIGGVNLLDMLAIKEDAPDDSKNGDLQVKQTATEPKADETPSSKGMTKWIKTDKSIGPLSVRRIGLSYDAPRIGIKFDAGLRLSCLTLSLYGFGLSYPIDKFTSNPKKIWEYLNFHLDGAAVAFEEGPLKISGGLLKVSDDPLQLDGTLLIQTEMFAFSAFGSYADLHGTPSFFVFAALQKELGGPAFFFVTGLAFGFGMNRTLKLPTINEVQNFPLIKAAVDPDYLSKELDLREISQKLDDYISPSVGNFWIAAGVKFMSFGMIDSFAILSVSFGTQFEIALLGLSKITIPKQPGNGKEARVIAYAELTIKAVFSTESGLLSFEARLTENSYILRKEFVLRGGFAFYSWFVGEHEGDFVISLGGYHPRFIPPAHYPKPDLVEFYCKLGNTTIEGHCYFALCPSAIMAGGGLSIIYQSGGVRAWFIAYADFLIQWKPLYYDIAIGISIGVALHLKIGIIRINLSIELSASVNLYGPPLGGVARISLYIITVTVKFGASRTVPPPLLWESNNPDKSFAKSFLPNPEVSRIKIADGLLKEIEHGDTTTRFVNPHKLVLNCRTMVPATEARYNTQEFTRENSEEQHKIPQPKIKKQPTKLGVRPMGKSSFHSKIDIQFEPNGNTSEDAREYLDQYIDVSLTTKRVPLALWGNSTLDTHTPPDDQMIDDVLVGLEIRTKAGPRPWETPALDLKVLAYDRFQKTFNWTSVKTEDVLPASSLIDKDGLPRTISSTINDNNVVELRKGILHALTATGRNIMKAEDIDLSQMEKNSQYIFQAMPAMARVGQYPPRGYLEI